MENSTESVAQNELKTIVDEESIISENAEIAAIAEKPRKEFERIVPEIPDRDLVEINLQSLLKAGAHFGHQTSRWHPKMAPYIYGSRNGIHIINLPITMQRWQEARQAIFNVVSRGGNILFVGTKKQAQKAVQIEARRCGAFFVSQRWLGGMITNFQTIRQSIERLKNLETVLVDEEKRAKFTKKELLMMDRDREKLEFSLGGIRDMHAAPQMFFLIDTKREDIAVNEAQRLDIPVVALVDTNCDPGRIDFPIPSNDDASRVISLFCAAVADTVLEAKKIYQSRRRSIEAEKASDNVQVVQRATNSDAKPARNTGKKAKKEASSEETVEEPDTSQEQGVQ